MKTVLYYFSGTGNSLQAARDLADYLGDATVLPMADLVVKGKEIRHKDGRIGLVFPTYCWGIPRLVRQFVDLLRPDAGVLVFSVVTCGGSIGGANAQLDRQLRGLGMSLYCGFSVRMPGNYTPMYGAPNPDKVKKMLARARTKLREAAKVIRHNKVVPFDNGDFFGRALGKLIYGAFMKGLDKADRKFFATDACTSCGLCARVCPVSNIKVAKKGKPEWQGKCEQCLACLQWCPEEAIQWGKRTAGRRRYRHPAIAVKEMFRRK